jgi:hypothetical protein
MHFSLGRQRSVPVLVDAKVGPDRPLPSLENLVYVGVSAGSIATTPYNCDSEWNLNFMPPGSDMAPSSESAMGLVDFALWVHLDNPDPIFKDNSMAKIHAEGSEWSPVTISSGSPARTHHPVPPSSTRTARPVISWASATENDVPSPSAPMTTSGSLGLTRRMMSGKSAPSGKRAAGM